MEKTLAPAAESWRIPQLRPDMPGPDGFDAKEFADRPTWASRQRWLAIAARAIDQSVSTHRELHPDDDSDLLTILGAYRFDAPPVFSRSHTLSSVLQFLGYHLRRHPLEGFVGSKDPRDLLVLVAGPLPAPQEVLDQPASARRRRHTEQFWR